MKSLEETCRDQFPDFKEENIRNYFDSIPRQNSRVQVGDILIRRQYGYHEPAWYGIVESVDRNTAQVITPNGTKRVPLNKVPGQELDWETKLLKADSGLNDPLKKLTPLIAVTNRKPLKSLPEKAPDLDPLSLLFTEDQITPVQPDWITEDVEKFDPGVKGDAEALNIQFWKLYKLDEVQPITNISPDKTPKLFANRVMEAQRILSNHRLGLNGVKTWPDGVLGYRTLVLLSAIAGNQGYENNFTVRLELAGIGINMQGLSSPKIRPALNRAWTILSPPNFVKVWSVRVNAKHHLKVLSATAENTRWDQEHFTSETLKQWLNDVLFLGNEPKWLSSDKDLRIRLSLLEKSFGDDDMIDVTAALVTAKRGFLHNRWDQITFFETKIKTFPPDQKMLWRKIVGRGASYYKDILDAGDVSVKNLGTVYYDKGKETTNVLIQSFVPIRNIDVTQTLRKFTSEMESIVGRLKELLEEKEYRHIKGRRIVDFLVAMPSEPTFGELFYDAVDKQFAEEGIETGGIEKLVSTIENLAQASVYTLLITFSIGGKYEKHPGIVRLYKSMEKLKESIREHNYVTSGDQKGIMLGKEKFIGLNEVTTGAYRIRKKETRLKKDRETAVVNKVVELFKKKLDEARTSGSGSFSLQDKVPDKIMEELIAEAAKELNITEKDNVEMVYEEGFRILDVRERVHNSIKYYDIKYERVFRHEQDGEYESNDKLGWAPMEGHTSDQDSFRPQVEFEEDLGWVYFANYMAATQKLVTAISVVGVAPVVVASGVVIGGKLVLVSIGISLGMYAGKVILTDEKWTVEGFFNAVVEGYVGAIGFRIFMPIGGALAGLLSSKGGGGFTKKLVQYVIKTGVGGGGSGAFTVVGSQFIEDIIIRGKISDAEVYIAKAKIGFCFGFALEFVGTPIMKKLSEALAPLGAKIKELSAKEIWAAAKDKLSKESLAKLPKELFESAMSLKKPLGEIFKDPSLVNAMLDKTAIAFKDFMSAAVKSPGRYLKEFEIAVYENAMFLAQKELSATAMRGFDKLIRAARASGMKSAEINKTVNLLKDMKDPKLVNAWLHIVDELDNAIVSKFLKAELDRLALANNILELRHMVGHESVTAVFMFHFKGSGKAFAEFAGKLVALGPDKAKKVIDLLFNKGGAVSPNTLLNLLQRNSSLEAKVIFGLERLGRGIKGLNLDVDQLLKSVPDGKVDDFLRAVGLLSEQELKQLINLYAKKDKALLDYLAAVSKDPSTLKNILKPQLKPGMPRGPVKTPVAPPPLPKSIASNKSFQQTGKPQAGTGLIPGKLRQLPKRTIFVAPNATSEAEAIQLFFKAYKDNPASELAIYQNVDTNEFIIVQGERATVSMGPGDPGFAKSVKEVLNHNFGNWQLRAHSHPINKRTGEVDLYARYPSGSTGDFGVLMYESAVAKKTMRSSSIFYQTSKGSIEQTIYTYNPKSLFKRYEIDIPAPGTGKRITKSFMSLNGYRRWYKKQFNIDLDGAGVASPGGKSVVTPAAPSAEVVALRGKIFDNGGGFKNSRLGELYEKYKTLKSEVREKALKAGDKVKAEEKILTKDEWLLAARGEAREILDKALGKDWSTLLKKARTYGGRMRGEISVEVTEELLSRFKPYPIDQVGAPPFEIGDRLTLGPSIERIDTDAFRKEFLDDLEAGLITHLDPYILSDFKNAFLTGKVGVTLRDIGPKLNGKGRYLWPLDDVGAPWQLHHIWPLEWNGKDVLPNLMPLRYRDHSALHEWWTELKDWVLSDWEARLAKKLAIQVEVK